VPSPSALGQGRRSAAWAVGLALAAVVTYAVGGRLPASMADTLAIALVLLVPGWLLIGGLGAGEALGAAGSVAAAPAAGLVLWALPLAVCFAFGLSLTAATVAVLVAAVMLTLRGTPPVPGPGQAAGMSGLAAAGAFLGVRWQSSLVGDALFHASVVRKLVALNGLSIRGVWPFQDGHPHAGYAFPLLHGAQAGAIALTHHDPSWAYEELVPVFAALVPVVAYATGRAVSGRAGGLATAVLALWVSLTGSQSISVAQQPRYVVTLLLVPTVLLLLVEIVRSPAPALRVLLVGAVAVIVVLHSTYAPVVLLMIAAVAIEQPALRRDVVVAAALSAAIVGWIYWEALWGLHYRPPVALAPLGFVTAGGHHIALSGIQVFERRPEYLLALPVLMLVLLRRRDGLGVLALAAAVAFQAAALPGAALVAQQLFGAGQVQRYAEEIPWVFVLGGAIGELAGARAYALAAGAGIVAVVVDRTGVLGTAAASGLAMTGAVAVLVIVIVRVRGRVRPLPLRRAGGSALAAAVASIAVLAGSVDAWGQVTLNSARYGKPQPTVDDLMTPAALGFLRAHDRGIPVVLAPYSADVADWYSGMSYQLVGTVTAYTVAISAYHSESELRDDPQARRDAVDRFLSVSTSASARRAILARYHVAYVALDLRTAAAAVVAALDADPGLRTVFTDPRVLPGHAQLQIWRVNGG
jgi:hypothetical protein